MKEKCRIVNYMLCLSSFHSHVICKLMQLPNNNVIETRNVYRIKSFVQHVLPKVDLSRILAPSRHTQKLSSRDLKFLPLLYVCSKDTGQKTNCLKHKRKANTSVFKGEVSRDSEMHFKRESFLPNIIWVHRCFMRSCIAWVL